jgi:hypothetical protein
MIFVVGLGFMEAPESSAISVCQPDMKLKPSNLFRQQTQIGQLYNRFILTGAVRHLYLHASVACLVYSKTNRHRCSTKDINV